MQLPWEAALKIGKAFRNRIAAGWLAFSVIAAAAFCAARPASAQTVQVSPPDTTVTIGNTFWIRVTTTAVSDLKAYELIFQFDPTVIKLLGASPGEVLTSAPGPYSAFLLSDHTAPADSAWYDAAMLTGSASGPGNLVYFHFKAVGEGVSLIQCRLVDFRDSANHQTLPACVGGRVVVVGITGAPRYTWGRLKTTYR
jgi:hypothetical protein